MIVWGLWPLKRKDKKRRRNPRIMSSKAPSILILKKMRLNANIGAKVEKVYLRQVREAVTKLINISSLFKIRCYRLLKPMDREVNGILRIQSNSHPQVHPQLCALKANRNKDNWEWPSTSRMSMVGTVSLQKVHQPTTLTRSLKPISRIVTLSTRVFSRIQAKYVTVNFDNNIL